MTIPVQTKREAQPLIPSSLLEGPFLLCSIVLGLLCQLVQYPLIVLFLNSFVISRLGDPAVVGWDNWRLALTEPGLRQAIGNTLLVTLTT
jgi:ABC-type sugar transport system permease subunit